VPSSCETSDSTSSIVMVSVSPLPFGTRHRPGSSTSWHGGDIHISGLYAPPSACTDTLPSAFTSSNRVAIGRCAVRRPS
jgi:hypothetical protein